MIWFIETLETLTLLIDTIPIIVTVFWTYIFQSGFKIFNIRTSNFYFLIFLLNIWIWGFQCFFWFAFNILLLYFDPEFALFVYSISQAVRLSKTLYILFFLYHKTFRLKTVFFEFIYKLGMIIILNLTIFSYVTNCNFFSCTIS